MSIVSSDDIQTKVSSTTMEWLCSNNGPSTICVYCGIHSVASNKILSICSYCHSKHEDDFTEARKKGTLLRVKYPHIDLWKTFTRIKTDHAKKNTRTWKKEASTMKKNVSVAVENFNSFSDLMSKLTFGPPKPQNKKKRETKTVDKKSSGSAIGYIYPCFSRHVSGLA